MLQDKLMSDLKEAMKSGDNVRRSVIRLVRAAIKNVEIAEQRILDDGSVYAVIAKEARQRRESIAEFKKGNRQDLVAKEEAELVILLAYLPEQLSREEIVAAARKVIEEIDEPEVAVIEPPKVVKKLKKKDLWPDAKVSIDSVVKKTIEDAEKVIRAEKKRLAEIEAKKKEAKRAVMAQRNLQKNFWLD